MVKTDPTTHQPSFSPPSPPNSPPPPTPSMPPTPPNNGRDSDSDEEMLDWDSDEAEPDEELLAEITAEAALADQYRAQDLRQPLKYVPPPRNPFRRSAVSSAIPLPPPRPPPTPRLPSLGLFQMTATPTQQVEKTGLCAVEVVYHEVQMTRGEERLNNDRKLREYRCFHPSGLRKCWTAVGEGFYETAHEKEDDKDEKEDEKIDEKDEKKLG